MLHDKTQDFAPAYWAYFRKTMQMRSFKLRLGRLEEAGFMDMPEMKMENENGGKQRQRREPGTYRLKDSIMQKYFRGVI